MTHAPQRPGPDDRDRRSDGFTRRFVIAFAIVEAIVIGWALLSGRIG